MDSPYARVTKPEVPAGVYWSGIDNDFHDIFGDGSMGNVFRTKWYHRRFQFPNSIEIQHMPAKLDQAFIDALLVKLSTTSVSALVGHVLTHNELSTIRKHVAETTVTRTRGDLRRAISNARRPNPADAGPDAKGWYDGHSEAVEAALAAFESAVINATKVAKE